VNPSLRAAGLDDAPAIVEVINRSFAVERYFIDGDRTDREEVLGLLARGAFLLAERDGALAGCVYVEVKGERGYLGLLAVEPALQGAGLGSRLTAAAERYAAARGCSVMDLSLVNLRVKLPAFYRRLGYEETGTAPFRAGAAVKQPCHFVLMSKRLAPSS